MSRPQEDAQTTPGAPPAMDEPLRPIEVMHAEEEARERTITEGEAGGEARRRGRIEAETRRVSDEMTRRAREQMRAAPAGAAPAATAAVGPPAETPRRQQARRRALPTETPIARIVVPLDGKPYAERAIPFAVATARATGAGLLIVYVRKPGQTRKAAPDATAYLRSTRERVGAMAPDEFQVDTLELEAPSVAEGVLDVVQREHVDLIVLATHARRGMERRILGSVGDRLIELGHTPLLFIPPELDVPETPPKVARVLVPLDGSSVAEQALALVLGLAAARGAAGLEVVLFQAAENAVVRVDAAQYLSDVQNRIMSRGLPAGVRVSTAAVVGSAPGAIVGAAEHGVAGEAITPGAFDLVAMSTHGRGGLQRWLYGTVSGYALQHIAVPVLLVHPAETDM